MPEDEKKDDLFEDLDKFFAPIQDVDWPETTTPEPEREERAEPERPEDTAAMPPLDAGDEEEPAAAVTPGQEELFEGFEGSEDAEDWEEDQTTVESFFASSDEDDEEPVEDAGTISDEAFSRPPSAYVDLPAPEDEEGVSEVDETVDETDDETVGEDEPSREDIEAAADHFAESVRDEVGVEPSEDEDATGADMDTGAMPQPFGDAEEVEEDILAGLDEPESSVRTVRVGPEGLGGPSWQEPTAVEVGADHERRPMGRDVPAAFATGLALGALALGSIAIGRAAFAVVAGAIVLWAQGELYRALQKHHLQPATALGLVGGALMLSAAYLRGEAAMLAVFGLTVFATFVWYMTTPVAHRRGTVANVGVTILGLAYVPLLAGYALTLLQAPDGRGLVVSVIALTFVYDTAAFIVGSWWGSRPLAPSISPKKSVEGAVGATLVVIAVAVGGVTPFVEVLDTLGRSVGLAVVVAIFAPLGDLAESLLKRDLGVKDMGSVLPGHGGVLDRIDSVLFVAPAAYLFLRLIL